MILVFELGPLKDGQIYYALLDVTCKLYLIGISVTFNIYVSVNLNAILRKDRCSTLQYEIVQGMLYIWYSNITYLFLSIGKIATKLSGITSEGQIRSMAHRLPLGSSSRKH